MYVKYSQNFAFQSYIIKLSKANKYVVNYIQFISWYIVTSAVHFLFFKACFMVVIFTI